MRALLVFVFLLAVVLAQTSAATVLPLSIVPNGVLVIVVCCGLVRGSERGMVWGFLGGLAIGLLSGAPLGAHALLLTVIGYLAGVGRASPFRSRLIVPLVAVSAATVAYIAGMALLLRMSGWPLALSPALLLAVTPAVLMNGVLMLVCYWLIAHLFQRGGGMRFELY